MDDILAQMKAKYGEEPSPKSPDQTQSPARSPSEPKSSQSIDDLLGNIQGKPAPSTQSTPPPSSPKPQSTGSVDQLLRKVQESIEHAPPDFQPENRQPENRPPEKHQPKNPAILPPPNLVGDSLAPPIARSPTDHLLSDLRTQYSEVDRAEQLRQQQEQEAERRRQEAQEQQKRAAKVKRAEKWLKTLDPRSGDAAWFEAFASNYDSRLEAALDYIDTLPQS